MRFLNPRKLQPLRRVMARKMPHETQRVGPAMSMSLSTTAWMLPLLHQSLGLPSRDPEPGTTPKIPKKPPVDPLLVSIDCEFIPHGTSRTIREIGISTLDTRRLKDLSSSSSISEFQNVIRTFNFTFIDLKKAKNQRPPRIFGFDHHAKASKSELRQVLHDFTTTNSSAGAPRDVLIVGHGISADILSMTRERFHLPNVEVLDTASVAARLFSSSQKLEVLDMEKAKGLKGALSLRRLIGKLGMPFRKRLFHNAGNDSHMTMRLLLQLGVESAVGTCQTVEHQSRVSVLRAIANSPLAKLSMHDESLFGHMQLRKIDERRNAYVQELAQREANALKSKAPTNTTRTPAPVDTETSSVSAANSNVPQNDTSIQLELSSILDLDSDPSGQASLPKLESSDTSSSDPSTSCIESSETAPGMTTLDLPVGASPHEHLAIQQDNPTLMTAQSARQRPASMMVSRLQQTFGFPQTETDNVVGTESPNPLVEPLLVSIDCEFHQPKGGLDMIREIGISTLDTWHLKNLSLTSSPVSNFQNVISAYNFTFEGAGTKFGKPRKFLFTESAHVSKSELQDVLREFTESSNGVRQGASRDVIIVGHSFDSDLEVLNREEFLIPNVELFDTLTIAQDLLAHETKQGLLAVDCTLRGLLQSFKIPHTARNLHNGGNDSHLTLRLLLMLAVKSITEKELTPSQKNTASVLNAVARSPLRRDSRLNDVFFNQNETEWVPSTLFKPIRNLKIRRRLRTFAKAETSFSSVSLKTPLIVTVPQSESSITVDSPLSNPSLELPIAKLESSSGSNIPSPQRSTKPNRRLRHQLLRRTCGKGRRAASRAANATTPYGQQQPSSVSKFSPEVPPSELESISLEKSPLSPNQEELSKPSPPKATPGSYFRTGLGYPPESIPPTSTQADSSVSV